MTESLQTLFSLKPMAAVLMLAFFWVWETLHPFFRQDKGRWRHAGRNLTLAVVNSVLLALALGAATVWVAEWTARNQVGLFNVAELGWPVTLVAGLVLLDAWMYVWHRANHVGPGLWRFHRMHHSDEHMDVTTATRFHLGELAMSAILRLGLIPLLGLQLWHLVMYDLLQLALVQFHHADISLERWDRWLRWLIVTPDMHKVHHSRVVTELGSNYSVVLSVWDRLAQTFRMRSDLHNIEFGLDDFHDPAWQTVFGMMRTPLAPSPRPPCIEARCVAEHDAEPPIVPDGRNRETQRC